MEATGLTFHRFQSGPFGGDQEIGAMIAKNKMDIVFFFRDPLTAQPHEPDVTALIRLCDVYACPLQLIWEQAKYYYRFRAWRFSLA